MEKRSNHEYYKKMKLNIHEIKPSSRRYPAIIFEREREAGNSVDDEKADLVPPQKEKEE